MRVGGKYPDAWHYNHMLDPTSMSPGSIMPRYPWLFSGDGHDASLNTSLTVKKMKAMVSLGVPYTDAEVHGALEHLNQQAGEIAKRLNQDPTIQVKPNEEIIALIAYLQRMGTDVKKGMK
jgi:cytochrome c oxidase cbb3-type subunit I/II